MKKNLIILLIIVVVVIVGVFVVSSKPKQEQTNLLSQNTGETIVAEETETNSLGSLSLNGSYKCTYTIDEQDLKTTTYVKNGKMRTEILLKDGDVNISLYTDNKVYQWSVKEKQGIFISVEEAKKQSGTEVQDPDKYLTEIKNKYQPDCENIDISDDLFVVPKDISFQDISQLSNH